MKDRRAFAIIAAAVVIGAVWAGYNLWTAGADRGENTYRALIWTVFATPFATFLGWAVARPVERWRAAFVCFMIYFFAILVAARIERLVLGEATATATGHALYFRLTLALDLLAGLGVALQRGRSARTIPAADDILSQPVPPDRSQA